MNRPSKGKLQVILGPMFSGKTSELIRQITRYKFAGYKCIIVHYSSELKLDHAVCTHDGKELPALSASCLQDVTERLIEYDVVGIDEGHIFSDLVKFVNDWSNEGKRVVVAGLDGTFQRAPFRNMLRLIPLAESVIKLSAVCMSCSNEAPFTKRLCPETEIEVLGGTDKYMAVCQLCYELPAPVKRSPFKKQAISCKKFIVPFPQHTLIDSYL